MFRKVPVDDACPASVIRDVRRVLARVPTEQSLRMIKIPAEHYARIVFQLSASTMGMPFTPTICGVPVEAGTGEGAELLVVHDDNTNALMSTKKERAA
jgi:hypothetical protein